MRYAFLILLCIFAGLAFWSSALLAAVSMYDHATVAMSVAALCALGALMIGATK